VTESEGIEMSDDQPTTTPATPTAPLRREALLPNERSRGLGTVAVVCTMAGVASGLALATTLMAMQVADTMSTRSCTYRAADISQVEVRGEHGFLGIRYVFSDGVAQVDSVLPGTPAEAIGIIPGDHVISVDGDRIDSASELQERIFGANPGSRPTLLIERDGNMRTIRPQLVSWPAISY
jgi:S1-C subfamily serine protease